jgi:DNA-binding response OmpR family regulator
LRVALLEDEPDHAALVTRALDQGGHSHVVFSTGARFQQAMVRETFDVLILDWMMPDTSGLDVLDWLRQLENHTPVLFLTSRDAEQDIVQALARGADDYLVKPPRTGELLARLQALKRRADGGSGTSALTVGPYEFDSQLSVARLHGQIVELTQRQFELALVLFRNTGRLLSRQYLLEAVWGLNDTVQTRTLDIHISQLRNQLQLADNGWRIHSVYAHGYRLEPLV